MRHDAVTTTATTLPALMRRNAATIGDRPAVREKDRGIWRTFTWAHLVPGMFSPCGTMQAAGGSYQLARDLLAQDEKVVAENLNVSEQEVTPQASFVEDLGADSLDVVELVMAFEEEFGIEIPDDAAETIQTVGDAVKFIEKSAT